MKSAIDPKEQVGNPVSTPIANQAIPQPVFKNILYATDFSPCSELALPYARFFAARYGSTVHLVHAVSPESAAGELDDPIREDKNQALLRKLEAVASGALPDIQHTQTVQQGEVRAIVSELAAGLNIDLIVIGTRGRTGVKHLVLGSVAEEILHRAACPVLTVGPGVRKCGMASGRLATILYATDLTPAAQHSLHYALGLAYANQARLHLLHTVSTEAETNPELVEKARKQLRKLIPQGAELAFEVFAECGSPEENILRAAEDTGVDLIVMGVTHTALPAARAHLPGAIAHKVVCRAPCPVLTVRK